MNKVHLIMPMAGAGSRFFKDGFMLPKPLLDINDKPFFFWAAQSIVRFVEVKDITFVILQKHVDEFEIDKKILEYYPDAKIVVIPKILNGAVLTCEKGLINIDDNLPIVFNDCDHAFVSSDFNDFCNKGEFGLIDGALLTFKSNDPKYSFLKINDNGDVIQTVEKSAISNFAICGVYYFKNKNTFLEAEARYLHECSYSEYYVSGVYNIIAEQKKIIRNFSCDIHVPFGTPDEYYEAKNSDIFKRIDK